MDPLVTALIEQYQMSPDLAQRVAVNLKGPGGAVDAYPKVAQQINPPPPEPAPARLPSAPPRLPPDQQIEEWVAMKEKQYIKAGATPEQLKQWADYNRKRYADFLMPERVRQESGPSATDNDFAAMTQAAGSPNYTADTLRAQRAAHGVPGSSVERLRAQRAAHGVPNNTTEHLQAQRINYYNGLVASMARGESISDEARAWLQQVHAAGTRN